MLLFCIAYKAAAWDVFGDYDDYDDVEEAAGLEAMYAELLGETSPDSSSSPAPTPRAVLKGLGVAHDEDELEEVT